MAATAPGRTADDERAPARDRRCDADPADQQDEVNNGPEDDRDDDDDAEDDGPVASERVWYASAVLTILAALLLGFVLQLVVVSRIEHYRSQRIAYAALRDQLANGVAPAGDLDVNNKPVPVGAPVAILQIPSIGMKEVVGFATTSGVLADGPGLRRNTPFPGQPGVSVVFGRRAAYGGPFARINSLKVGARITVTTGQGVNQFRVLDVRTAGDPIPEFTSGTSRLTLLTATGAAFVPGGVVYVDAALTSAIQPSAHISATGLPSAEKALAGQPDAWLQVVLWGMAFVLAAVGSVYLRARWGRWQSWLVSVPVLATFGVLICDNVIRLLPNLT